MRYIDENRIYEILEKSKNSLNGNFEAVLKKSRSLQRLSLEETSLLLSIEDPEKIKKIFQTATYVKNKIYGRRTVLFVPLYISNYCNNNCVYCAFRAGNNELIERKSLTADEIKSQTLWLLKRGHKRILMVSGEAPPPGKKAIDYYIEAIESIYSVAFGPHKIRRVNVNCAPLEIEEFKQLKKAGIGTYQLFQETYHEETYRKLHPSGPKSDPDMRIEAIDKAFNAGIDDVGVGVLYGLYDWRFDTLALLMHIEHLEKKFGVGPHTISVPRLEPALGSDFSWNSPFKVSDEDFKKIVAVLRLSVPYTGMILSTRETPLMRDELFNLGISQISAESRTGPGEYGNASENQKIYSGQFVLSDNRSLEEIIETLINKKNIPSFCTACYRKARTGEVFMDLAKPGKIKQRCNLNALLTLKEYLEDFASENVKSKGLKLIEEVENFLDLEDQNILKQLFKKFDHGERDLYI